MHFDVQIIDDNTFDDFLEYSKDKLNNEISLIQSEEIKNINRTDLLIIDIEHPLLNQVLTTNKYIILLIKDEEQLEQFKNIEKIDTLYLPLDFDKLILKIRQYINILNRDFMLKQEEEISNSIVNNITNPIFLTDGFKILFANNYFLNLIGLSCVKEINEKYQNVTNLFECIKGFLSVKDENWLLETKNENCKVCILDKDLNKKYFSIQRIFLTHNNTNIIILNDISYEINHKEELYKLLYTDSLTKQPNRAKLIEQLQNKTIVLESIAILDINSFKEINDFFGHKVGDYILIEIGKLVQECIKENENIKLYKFPSDTYCITNTNEDQEVFVNLIEKIMEAVYKKVFYIDSHEIDVRITAGISHSNKNNKLITADIALQSAKKSNKDYLVFFDELDKFQEYENNMLWTKKLKNAFAKDKIEVFFQPLVNNNTLKVEKYECLVRLIDEEDKVISPFFFLDISKKSNQYTKLTKIVIEKSFKKFQYLPFEFSVNISYEDIEDENFLVFIKEMLRKYNVVNKVVFEILENENIKNYSLLINFIDEIKLLGCKVAIDDFGSGYSNFEHLLKMNVDYLKIDASLIKNIAIDDNSYKITKTIIEFAKSLNLKTIAEFVENEDIFNIVKKLGADYSQGYYFSAPISEPLELNFSK